MKGLNKIKGPTMMIKASVQSLKQLSLSVIVSIITMLVSQKSLSQGTQIFSTAGTFTNGFTVPAGVTSITVQVWGGGGGGGQDGVNNGQAGGGGGAYASSVLSVAPGNQFTIVVGAGGTATNPGGQSAFGSLVIALGGGSSTTAAVGTGGQASGSTGNFKSSGGNGGIGSGNTAGTGGSGGGSSASAGGNGVNGSNFSGVTGGVGGDGPDGDGGKGGNSGGSGATGAQPGTFPGGGGGGRGDNGGTSAAGARGQVIVTWTCPAATISYAAPGFCKSITSASATITGSPGGTFTATPGGLTINSSTGVINPSTSTAATYTVHYQIAAANGCPAVDATASVKINPTPVSSATSTNITCAGASDGTITVSATGGTSPYTFSIDNGANFQPATGTDLSLFTGLAPNIPYTIKVKDDNGCISK